MSGGEAGYRALPDPVPSCKRCRGTGRMGYVDSNGDADVDVCDCIVDQVTPGRTTSQEER